MNEAPLNVNLPGREYPIFIGNGLAATAIAERVHEDLSEKRRIAVITDVHVAAAQPQFLETAFGDLPMCILPAGEPTKCFAELARCCEFLASSGLDRHGRVFAVGGGVIGDLAGFAAASYQRGIGFYQVPTSLLAMVDSSVGGKTGINLPAGKNLVGAFHQPLAVYADVQTLQSLPSREFSAGMAEIIKHGLLADGELFEQLESMEVLTPESPELASVIRRNCGIKASVVLADEREEAVSGGRALLNLGHTFGHAIEAVAGYGEYLHGEAIAVGLVLAARLSAGMGRVPESVAARIERLLQRYGLPVRLRAPLSVQSLIEAARRDKKVRLGSLRYVVLEAIGRAVVASDIEESSVADLWRESGAVD
jgi:3-dehydroquinate synthase